MGFFDRVLKFGEDLMDAVETKKDTPENIAREVEGWARERCKILAEKLTNKQNPMSEEEATEALMSLVSSAYERATQNAERLIEAAKKTSNG